jgi:hypothetical protein
MDEGSIAEMMRDYADAAVELARDFGVTLDFSENSLQQLEGILAQLYQERRAMAAAPAPQQNPTDSRGEAPSDSGAVEEQMVMMCKLWGGYLGEVVRRRWGGEWTMETYPGAGFATLTLNVRGAKLFPSMKIYRRLTEGVGDDVWSFYQRVRGKLEAFPERD